MQLAVTYPPITSYPPYAFILSAILCTPNGENWYLNNYIQLYTEYRFFEQGDIKFRDDIFGVHRINGLLYYHYNPFFRNIQTFDDISILVNPSLIIETLKTLINQGYYTIIHVDRHYLRNEIPLGSIHSAMIYGYEDEFFHIADFTDHGRYEFTKVSYADLVKSYRAEYNYPSFVDNKYKVVCFSIQNAEYDVDLKLIRQLIIDYLNEESTVDSYECVKDLSRNKQLKWGMGCYGYFLDQLASLEAFDAVDIRNPFILLDQKLSMIDKIEYFLDKNIVDDIGFLSEYQELACKIKKCLNICIKYNHSKKSGACC